MKRTTVFMAETLERDLQLYARRVGKPTSAIVREALEEYIARKRPAGELPSFTGAFDSGRSDTAERHEEILFRHLAPHEAIARPRTGSRPASPKRRRREVG
jgi:hypothetical protein